MAGTTFKKRGRDDGAKGKGARPPFKKQKRQKQYHSSSEEEEDEDDNQGSFKPVNLLDSDDEDIQNAMVDDGAASDAEDASSSDSDDQQSTSKSQKPQQRQKKERVRDAPADDASQDDDEASSDGGDESGAPTGKRTRSKRNDESAFATSISKILSSKLSTAKRADPIVSRSAEAHSSARQAVDSALDAKARKRLRDAKRLAQEKGRVRDVLVASTIRTFNVQTGEIEEVPDAGAEATTTEILETERRLRKVAQRGVVKLFNAVRAAQAKASIADKVVRQDGMVGMGRREEKVTEMSRKGFLDLLASGGGKLNKKPLEEG